MSYCRLSSMNWKCDLYCYQDADAGYVTHVASRRRVGDVPPDSFGAFRRGEISGDEYMKQDTVRMEALAKLRFEPIDLPHAGETFFDPTLGKFKLRLLELRMIGYRFPDGVLEEVEREIAEERAEARARNSDGQ